MVRAHDLSSGRTEREGADEFTLGLRQGCQRDHHRRTGRLARQCDRIRIAAEVCDVGVHPVECGKRIRDREIAGLVQPVAMQLQEAERPKPVVDGDNYSAIRRELGAVIVATGVLGQPAAVDPYQHRQARSLRTQVRRAASPSP